MNADDLWYRDAVIYQVHVKAFFDSNDDGIGDFRGLTQKLDYIRDLGVSAVWLMPFYPSPLLDDGYDVADYEDVHPPYGTREDAKRFIDEAHARDLRVITELVVNHTSDQHPWFQAARRAPRGSVKRDYYVWSDDPNKYAGTRIIFSDSESSNWEWDPVAQQHYWHRFFSHQPDLNYDNPHVLRAVLRTMHFWLDMGVDGFRLDAIPYLVEREGTANENNPETHAVIRQIRADLDEHYSGRMLLAEANMWPEDVRSYFGAGDECHMCYHFPLMPRLYMSIAMEDRHPLVDILAQTPPIPPNCQWAIFLRNHDELTLEMVTDRERDYMYRFFAAESRMRVNGGIRRRLAPLMENSRAKIELITFLLMTMPGSPILYYGDEIGMGDNIYLGDRNSVRTPMQWSPDRNAGFSRADPQRLYLPPVMDAMYGYESVNVETQARSPSSLLNWTRRMVATRRRHAALGRGTITFLEPGNRKVIAYLREVDEEAILCVANLARVPQAVELDLARFAGRVPVELYGGEPFPPVGKLPYLVTLTGHGHMAWRLAADAKPPGWHEERLATRRLPVLVLSPGWQSFLERGGADPDLGQLFQHVSGSRLRDDVFLPYLRSRRWFAARNSAVTALRPRLLAPWRTEAATWQVSLVDAELASGEVQRYFLPLALDWEARDHDPLERFQAFTVTKLRHKDRMGIAYAAFADPRFSRDIARAMLAGAEVPLGPGRLRFSSIAQLASLAAAAEEEPRTPSMEQSNTAVYFGNKLFLKAFRHLRGGVNPELEMGRFLTEASPCTNVAPVLGAMEYVLEGAPPVTLAMMQRFVENQGDLWTIALEHLARLVDGHAEGPQADAESEVAGFHLGRMALLGGRVAELHAALARVTGDPAFDPEPASIDGIAFHASRFHGNLHLGQILVARDDFVIVDFEGDPAQPPKSCVLRDVAGMLRSFGRAARAAAQRRDPPDAAHARALADWERDASRHFLEGYLQAATGLATIPADERASRALVERFLIEQPA